MRGIGTPGITRLIGNTPLLRVRLFEREFPNVEVYAKAEWFNPGGSVKDRAALAMIEDGERRGALTRAKAIVTAFGAEIVYSDAGEGSDGAIVKVREIVKADPDAYFYPDQYSNPANPRAHYEGTAVEILEQTAGRITHFVAGLGTTGTFVGTSRRLKEHDSSIYTIAVQPEDSFHGLEGLKHIPTAIVPKIWDPSLADDIWGCPTEPAYDLARMVARTEGLLVGHSSGAALWGVRRLAETIKEGVVVTVFPDSGDRYLSTGLYGRK